MPVELHCPTHPVYGVLGQVLECTWGPGVHMGQTTVPTLIHVGWMGEAGAGRLRLSAVPAPFSGPCDGRIHCLYQSRSGTFPPSHTCGTAPTPTLVLRCVSSVGVAWCQGMCFLGGWKMMLTECAVQLRYVGA